VRRADQLDDDDNDDHGDDDGDNNIDDYDDNNDDISCPTTFSELGVRGNAVFIQRE
jgi:hypothetical protein